jgi:hypothetical protein
MHTGPIGIEDPHYFDPDIVLLMIIDEKGFSDALSFIIT